MPQFLSVVVADPTSQADDPARPLCPACGSPVVRIEASVEVKYHVHYAVTARDLEVIEEQFGDGEWNEDSPAVCNACGWHGSVAELLGDF